MPMSTRLEVSSTTNVRPRTAPKTVPRPPVIETPPRTTAAMMSSSAPEKAPGLALRKKMTWMTPAIAARTPATTNASVSEALTGKPMRSADSRLPPMA